MFACAASSPDDALLCSDELCTECLLTPAISALSSLLLPYWFRSTSRGGPMPRMCELFIRKLQRNLCRIMREKGGTEYSILRTNFLNWDADKSGEIGPEEFRGAMSILGLKLSPSEAKSICDYYDVEGDGEMKYQPLVDDVTKGTSHFLVHPHTERKATPKTPTTDLALAEKIKGRYRPPPG